MFIIGIKMLLKNNIDENKILLFFSEFDQDLWSVLCGILNLCDIKFVKLTVERGFRQNQSRNSGYFVFL